jgi:hypothetical protein
MTVQPSLAGWAGIGPTNNDSATATSNTGHLTEIAELLALGITRLKARRIEGQSRESSTGLSAQTERVLMPETGS